MDKAQPSYTSAVPTTQPGLDSLLTGMLREAVHTATEYGSYVIRLPYKQCTFAQVTDLQCETRVGVVHIKGSCR